MCNYSANLKRARSLRASSPVKLLLVMMSLHQITKLTLDTLLQNSNHSNRHHNNLVDCLPTPQITISKLNPLTLTGADKSRSLVLNHAAELPQPDFSEPIGNHTVARGQDAQLACKISNLGSFRPAWLRVEDKGILTIHNHVINKRFDVMNNEAEQSFVLIIRDVQPADRGGYMCQINSVPMKFAVGYLDVHTAPVFIDGADGAAKSTDSDSDTSNSADYERQQQAATNSSQTSVIEGAGATLTCTAQGHPKPSITWRREDGKPILLNGQDATLPDSWSEAPTEIKDTSSLTFSSVNRFNSGAYLCIASNGVQPSASKRQLLDVRFSPTITVPETEIAGWLLEREARLECLVELNPGGSYHWVKLATSTTNTDRRPVMANQEDDLWLIEHDELMPSDKFDIVIKQINSEKVRMVLKIRRVEKQDFSWYKCIAKNNLGLQSNFVRFYESPNGYTATPAATTTTAGASASSSFSFKNIIRLNEFIGGGSGSGGHTTGDEDNKLNLPQNDDSRLSFQRSSSSSSSSSATISNLLSCYVPPKGPKQSLASPLKGHLLLLLSDCQMVALSLLVLIASYLNQRTITRTLRQSNT